MESSKKYNKTLGRMRLATIYVMVAGLIVLARPTPLSVSLGFPFVFAGETIRFWAAGHLRKTVELITSGPYRHTRNPLYLGRLLIFSGLCIMAQMPYLANLAVLVVGWIIFFGYYLRRKERVEPERLRQTHGEAYERYFRAVPALFPSLSPYPEGASIGWASERMLRNREHWMVIGMLAFSLLLLWIAHARPEGILLGWLNGS